MRSLLVSLVVHGLLLLSIFDIYFKSPVEHSMLPQYPTHGPPQRLSCDTVGCETPDLLYAAHLMHGRTCGPLQRTQSQSVLYTPSLCSNSPSPSKPSLLKRTQFYSCRSSSLTSFIAVCKCNTHIAASKYVSAICYFCTSLLVFHAHIRQSMEHIIRTSPLAAIYCVHVACAAAISYRRHIIIMMVCMCDPLKARQLTNTD